jgi:hypothetical protein
MLCKFVVRERPSVLIFHRSSIVILLGRFLCVLGPFLALYNSTWKTPGFGWGYMDKKLGVGRAGGVGEVGCGWGRVALHLRDRLADLAVCLPGGFLARFVAVVCVFAARAPQPGGLAGASVASYIMLLAGVHLDLVGLERVLQAPNGWAGCLATERN